MSVSAPSPRYLELARASGAELETAFLRGATPEPDDLAGWEFRGLNHPAWARLAGVKKFVKGFYWKGAALHGYNCPVRQNRIASPWHLVPSDERPKRFGYYLVEPVDPAARDNAYLHAVLLDYGRGGNKRLDPTRGLRDYLVKLDDDLFLGKAYYALGPVRVAASFFLLERLRPGLGPVVVHASQS